MMKDVLAPKCRTVLPIAAMMMACGGAQMEPAAADGGEGAPVEVVLAADVKWEPLNPARGDKSPLAATLWGDRNGSAATGFLFHPVDGFKSPPHIHNVSYRGVVIRGVVHNDAPSAEEKWMPPGSYWTQPKGQSHITAARGEDTLAYIEIDEGPYLVHPPEDAFDSEEGAVNVDAAELVWKSGDGVDWITSDAPAIAEQDLRVAPLWGSSQDDGLNGMLLSLPARASVELGGSVRAVVIGGTVTLEVSDKTSVLELGAYFASRERATHRLRIQDSGPAVLYIRARGPVALRATSKEQ